MNKVVIDTNLLIDGVNDDYHYANRIIDAVLDGRLDAFATPATLKENKLLARRKIEEQEYLKKLEKYFSTVKKVKPVKKLTVVEDPEDNKLLESAAASSAEYLITSDKHLLKLERYEGIRIVTPTQFWNLFEEEVGEGWIKWVDDFVK